MRTIGLRVILTLIFVFANTQAILAQENDVAIVQVILFYRTTCPHCHEVIENHLPKIKEEYGNQLQIVGVDTSNQVGAQLYSAAVTALNIPTERRGVPTLVIGDVVLVGGQEIPEQLPNLVTQGLAEGGIGWPNIPGLREAIPNLPPTAGSMGTTATTLQTPETNAPVLSETLSQDSAYSQDYPVDFIIGWFVMMFMIASIIFTLFRMWSQKDHLVSSTVAENMGNWIIPIIALAGLGIAGYLAYVEISRVEAVCGPIGECNIVQSSQFAQILGIPVAVFGLLFYFGTIVLWLLLRFVNTRWAKWIPVLLLVATFLGTIFSIYLTLLELTVIGAICAWCLSSAIITTTMLLVVVAKYSKSKDKDIHKRGKPRSLSPIG